MGERSSAVRYVVVGLGLAGVSGIARGHGRDGVLFGGPSMGFAAVVFLSVALCVVAGVLTVRYRALADRHAPVSAHSMVGALVLLLGFSLVASTSLRHPTIVGSGAVAIGLLVGAATERWSKGRHRHGDITTGALFLHRTLEGALLATVYSSNLAVGPLGAVVLTIHAIAETVVVGGIYGEQRPKRAWAAIVVLQLAYIGGAVVGAYSSAVLSKPTRDMLLATVGGVLFVIGTAEVRG
jgi:zinc transporter ZupT